MTHTPCFAMAFCQKEFGVLTELGLFCPSRDQVIEGLILAGKATLVKEG
jgi:hypothetical protein